MIGHVVYWFFFNLQDDIQNIRNSGPSWGLLRHSISKAYKCTIIIRPGHGSFLFYVLSPASLFNAGRLIQHEGNEYAASCVNKTRNSSSALQQLQFKLSKKTTNSGRGTTTAFHLSAIADSFFTCLLIHQISQLNNFKLREVALWTNHRVMEWLRSVDLSEYAPNLRGSGVHGAFMVRFFMMPSTSLVC